jgi:hypothetical protein
LRFLCEEHDQLTGNVNFQDNLLDVQLTRKLPWEEPPSPEMHGPTKPQSAPAEAGSPDR